MTGAVALASRVKLGDSIGHVGQADVARLSREAMRIRNIGHQHGGASLWQRACDIADDGHRMLEFGSYSDRTRDELINATGRAHMFAGWLAFDSGSTSLARAFFNEALSLARQSGDPGIETHALVNLAFQSSLSEQPRQALRYADAAERSARQSDDDRMTVVPELRRAVAYAVSNDLTASGRAVGNARRSMDRVRRQKPDAWCSFISPAELDGLEATCMLMLRQDGRAEALFQQAIDVLNDNYARNRALYRVRLAAARLNQHEEVGAAEAGLAALDDLDDHIESWIINSELAEMERRLQLHSGCDVVDSFLHRLHLRQEAS